MHPTDRHPDRFQMHWSEGHHKITRLLRAGEMNSRDLRILWVILGDLDPMTCRASISPGAIAKEMDTAGSYVRAGLARLKRLRVIATWRDARTGHSFFLVNPELVTIGGAQRRGYLIQLFRDAIDGQDTAIQAPLPAHHGPKREEGAMDGLQP